MTDSQTCPACGNAASGRFCSDCGATLGGVPCAACGNTLPTGGRFCNQCGAAAAPPAAAASAAPAAGGRAQVPWVVAGVLAVALIAAVVVPRLGGGDEAPQPAPAPGAAPMTGPAGGPGGAPLGGAAGVDLSSMTPREAADRLFNRVMTAQSSGDTAQARTFVPMAIGAYGRVDALDLDGRYHLALLHLVAGEPAEARAQTDTILAAEPNHLLGLFTAAEAEEARGDQAAARVLYQRFLASYESEMARQLPEYRDHGPSFPTLRQQAQAAVAG